MFCSSTRASSSRLVSAVASSSRASSSSTKAALPKGRLPASTLRSLIDLHHTSSSFMQQPASLEEAIQSTFRDYNKESQGSFEDFARDVQTLQGKGSPYVPRGNAKDSIGEAGSRGRSAFNVRPVLSDVFARSNAKAAAGGKVSDSSSWAKTTLSVNLFREGPSPRELAVREALYGSWESGAQILPGLEGVLEYVEMEGEGELQGVKVEEGGKGETL